MEHTLGDLIQKQSWVIVLDSVLPGQSQWETYIGGGGDCKKSCPAYKNKKCEGYGPGDFLCTSEWSKSEARPDVLDALFHILNNFDHYNREDLPSLNKDSSVVKELRARVYELAQSSASDFDEGDRKLQTHYFLERRTTAVRKLKTMALKSEHVVCGGCKKDYFDQFGPLSISLIECHHMIPLGGSQHWGRTRVEDLILLCANCHRLIHSREIDLDLKKLREKTKKLGV